MALDLTQLFLLNLKQDTRTPQQMRDDFERHHRWRVVDWDEDRTKFAKELILNHLSYRPTLLFPDLPVITIDSMPDFSERFQQYCAFSPGGRWAYYHRALVFPDSLELAQNNRRGLVRFTDTVAIPTLAEMDNGGVSNQTWMSLTPMEMLTQRKSINLAKGNVVIGGLGMGWQLQKVCAKKSVKKVVVIEKDAELLGWLQPVILAAFPQVAAKQVEWIRGDAFAHVGCLGKDAIHLFDIWPEYGDAADDPRIAPLRAAGYKIWAWGESSWRKD